MSAKPAQIDHLAIVAGAGYLPRRLAEDAARNKLHYVVVARPDQPLDWVHAHPNLDLIPEKTGQVFNDLKAMGITNLVMAGAMSRPNLKLSKLDFATIRLVPKIIKGLTSGDDDTLRKMIALVEGEGLDVVAAQDLCPDLLVKSGAFGAKKATKSMQSDLAKGRAMLNALSEFDNGQGCVISGGKCLAIETASGTDAMLEFTAQHHPKGKIRKGLLLKMPKLNQDLRADLPSIGPDTVEMVAKSALAGICLPIGEAFILDPEETKKRADQHGIFIHGFQND